MSARPAGAPRRPVGTYRLQLRQGVGFADARRLLPYLSRLGVSDLYLSPPFAAQPGSAHGYDVIDPNRLDPALGGRRAFEALARELRSSGLGLLVDIVPNHLAATPANPWWRDVLRRGRGSPFARFFDIDWDAPGADGKLLLPVLERPLEELLAEGAVGLEEEGREVVVALAGLHLPISPASERAVRERGLGAWNRGRASPQSARTLRELIEEQAYRPLWWREGDRRVNYRRFFDIAGLAGLREEDPRVFDRVHAAVVRLVQEGTITGLRIDHVDGLLDPEDYLLRLRRATRVPYLAVEKVLHRDEVLPGSWPVQGSTGYALLNDLTDLTVDPQGWRELGAVTERLRGDPAPPFERIRLEARRQVLRELFGSEVQALVRRVARLASGAALDLEEGALREAVVELTAALEGYRTYVGPEGAGPEDRRRIERAVRAARGHLPRSARPALRFVHRVLTLELPPVATARTRSAWLEVVERWQQLSGPAAAKGVEDTALYREVRLICRNEVGADPGREPADLPGFHRRIRELHEGPHPLIATSTHDTKRSEDVRARIAVLSELPGEWERRAARWIRANRRHRRGVHGHDAPDRDEELLLYQTLLGAWPQDEDLGPFAERIRAYVVKAAREAKVHTSWLDPDAAHERTLEAFATAVIADQRFLRDFLPLQRTVAFHGALNSLSQVVLRTALPGVADLYNGTETWDLSLVDPDNRRPLDIRALARRLAELDRRQPREGADLASDLIGAWPDGLVKLFAVSRCLRLRRERPDVFVEGSYLPLQVHGPAAAHAVAIARRAGERWALAIVPRLTLRLAGPGRAPIGERIWAETVAMLPRGAPRTWVDAFTARSVGPDARGALALGQVLAPFPVALLVPAE